MCVVIVKLYNYLIYINLTIIINNTKIIYIISHNCREDVCYIIT